MGTTAELAPRSEFDIVYTRALGWELHLLLGYNFKFDPAGSNIFLSFLGQAGSYDLLETSYQEAPIASVPAFLEQRPSNGRLPNPRIM